jgi:anthranilate synthase component 1
MSTTPFIAQTTHRSILADTLTPVAMYMRLRDNYPGSILLESNEYGHRSNSYSFLCCNPVASFEVTYDHITTSFPDGVTTRTVFTKDYNLTEGLNTFKNQFAVVPQDTPYPTNGLFGYLSYDAVQLFENIRFKDRDEHATNIPLANYQLFQTVIVFDHYFNRVHVYDNCYEGYDSKIDEVLAVINHRDVAHYDFHTTGDEQSELTDDAFKELVEKGKQHCRRGDVFQMVLSRKFTQSFRGDDFNVYRQLRAINPSPYLFYFDYGNFRIMGSSPEAQILINGTKASIQPIAGTYKRTGNDLEDLKAAEALKSDPKETAEHVMLVDLARNDLSRHARQVSVASYQDIHFYSHVIHMVSKVTGVIAPQDKLALVADTFPAGTLSGAPKFNAMQLIDSYENSSRTFYGGAIGFLGFDGDFNHAIVIRSILSQNNELQFRAGAGVVVASNLESEMQEVYHKTNALRSAIKQANNS